MIREIVRSEYDIAVLYKDKTMTPKTTNTIVTGDLKQSVDITRLNLFPWGRFDVENNYNGKVGYVKDDTMQGRVTVFSSGKLISTGGRSVTKSIEQLKTTMQLLAKNGFVNEVKLDPKVRNVVAILDVQARIDLNFFASVVPSSMFEPELFPGLIHKVSNGATCLIFSSGKVVIAGAKSEPQLLETAQLLEETLRTFMFHS